jgi:hypothetical protein
MEQHIAFMSKALKDSDLKYTTRENQAYALVHYLKYLRLDVGYSNIIADIPHAIVKDILTQQDFLGIHCKWAYRIQQYDMEIKPTKLVKVQGLARMFVEGNERDLNMNEEETPKMVVVILDEITRGIYGIKALFIT